MSQGQQHSRVPQQSRTYPRRSRIAQLLRYPSVQQGMQLPLTFSQSMLGPRIEHQLLGLIGLLVNLSSTARGEAGVRQAVDEQQGPRRDIDSALGPVGLGGERDHGDDLVGEGAGGNDHRAAEGVPHEDDARAAAALQERQPGPHVQHGLDVHAWVAVVEAQRGETLLTPPVALWCRIALIGPRVVWSTTPWPVSPSWGGPVSTPQMAGAGVCRR